MEFQLTIILENVQLLNNLQMRTRTFFFTIFPIHLHRGLMVASLLLIRQRLTNGSFRFQTLSSKLIFIEQIQIFMRTSNKNRVWCQYEDKLITDFVKEYGVKNWAKIAEQLHKNGFKQKTGKQCRERWHNHLDPNIKKRSWTREEQDVMFEQHKKHGNKWTIIAQKLQGRTDNAIKNHFYSTIRKSLRRISKLKGDRNSTHKMRLIKPSTLSKIFSLAEANPEQQITSSSELSHQMSCRQIAHYLLNFSRQKLGNKKYKLDVQEQKNFDRILSQMQKINHLYENQKLEEAKLKKQKQLQKNFDIVASSSQDQEKSQSQQKQSDEKIEEQQQHIVFKSNDLTFTTRSKRKVRPPSYYQIQYSPQKKQRSKQFIVEKIEEIVIKQENQGSQIDYNLNSSLKYQDLEKQRENNCFEFKLNEENMNEIQTSKLDLMNDCNQKFQLGCSPGIRFITPFAITPYGQLIKQINIQPIKNEECDLIRSNMINEVLRRSSFMTHQSPRRPILYTSPTSAFRQYQKPI